MSDAAVRAATSADAGALAELHLRSRTRAYADYLPHDQLDDDAAERRRAWWAEHAGDDGVWLLEESGVLGGFVAVGPGSVVGEGELRSLYVEPAAQGAGVGGRLLRWAEEALRARGLVAATLWVYEENEQARTFYERAGWVQEPREAWAHLHGEEWSPAVRYRRELA